MNDINSWRETFFSLNPDAEVIDTKVSKSAHKLDLFKTVLPAIDRRDIKFYSKLTPEEQDSIEPWILMRAVSSVNTTDDQRHFVDALNTNVNKNFSILSAKKTMGQAGHKELQWMLLAMCGRGRTVYRKFMKPPRGAVKNKLELALLELNPLLKDDEIELIQQIHTHDELCEYFKENALDDKTITELLKAV